MEFPGFSTTLTTVPLGPGNCLIVSLRFSARVELVVMGTMRMVVAPAALNQVALLVLKVCLLFSLVR